MAFVNDFLIYSFSIDKYAQHLALVMDILESQQLYVNEKKCEFCKPKVAYLGHIVSCEGVAVNPEKVQAMVDWPPPRAIKEIRKFLGLTSYSRRFIRHYASLT